MHILTAPSGVPKLAGLSSFEFQPEDSAGLQYSHSVTRPSLLNHDYVSKYCKCLDSPMTHFGLDSFFDEKLAPDLSDWMFEMTINLPVQLIAEQIEVKLVQ